MSSSTASLPVATPSRDSRRPWRSVVQEAVPEDRSAPALELLGISKHFSGTDALVDVTIKIERPMIYGIVGQNGAGKSTLLKILAGDYQPSSGEIRLGGTKVEIANQRRALALGIGLVYQELSLLPNLSVAHNIVLGQEPMSGMRVDERRLLADARLALARVHAQSIPLSRKVGDLTLSQRQLVEIAKVLTLRQPRVLIFDEPTAALGQADVLNLFEVMERLREQGVTILFVSHRYREVLTICEHVTVLRNGRVIAGTSCKETSLEKLVELTVGQKTETMFKRRSRRTAAGEVVLAVGDLHVGGRVRGVDMELRRGGDRGPVRLAGLRPERTRPCPRWGCARRQREAYGEGRGGPVTLPATGAQARDRHHVRKPSGRGFVPRFACLVKYKHCVPAARSVVTCGPGSQSS